MEADAACSVFICVSSFCLATAARHPQRLREPKPAVSSAETAHAGFPLVGVTEEVSRAERRLLPQDDPARQPPCFSLISILLALDRLSTHHSAAGKKTETRLACSDTEATACRLLQLHWVGKHPPRSSSGDCSTSWSV